MKQKKRLSHYIGLCLAFFVILLFTCVDAKASDSGISYSEYDFITKEETFGIFPETSSVYSRTKVTRGISEGFEGLLPYDESDEPGISPNSVIGTDDRFVINNTNKLPMRWIGYLESHWRDGSVTRASGWLYGDSVAVTAGHAIYDYDKQTYPERITFSPGYNNGHAPYGTFSVTRARVTRQYREDENNEGDVGILKLSLPIGQQVGYFSFEYNTDINAYANTTVGITGYPADKGTKMYGTSGKILESYQRRFHYQLDATAGQDGAPIFYKDPNNTNNRVCIGIHTDDVPGGFIDRPENSGVRIFQTLFNYMKSTQAAFGEDVAPPIFSDGSEFWGRN